MENRVFLKSVTFFFLGDIANLKRTVVSGFVGRGLLYPMGLVSGHQMTYGWNGFQTFQNACKTKLLE